MQKAPILELRGITKRFPGVVANNNIDLNILPGEVHGLLGENGAGKTTLMKVLYGLYQPTSGEIIYKGQKAHLRSPKDALRLGIGMVHQHFKLVPTLTVAENIILGAKDSPTPFVNLSQAHESIRELGARYGLDVDPTALVWSLSTGEQQRVEILKALYRKAELLILDEPTAVLTPQLAEALFHTLGQLVEAGLTIIFITHKLKEIMATTHRVSVLRRGELVATEDTVSVTRASLAELMVGRKVLFEVEKEPSTPGKPVIEAHQLHAVNSRGLAALNGATLTVRSGEVVGIAGVSGNGQSELAEVLTGLRQISAGKILFEGVSITKASVRDRLNLGMAHIPEDRIGQGLALSLSVAENIVLHEYRNPEFGTGWFLNYNRIRQHARSIVKDYDVRTPGIDVPARQLSGGNLQKVILGRELSRDPKFIVANQPTRGLDVGSCEHVRKNLIRARDRGAGVLLISEDLDELFDVSDRILVMYRGVPYPAPPGADLKTLGLMMAGENLDAIEAHEG